MKPRSLVYFHFIELSHYGKWEEEAQREGGSKLLTELLLNTWYRVSLT